MAREQEIFGLVDQKGQTALSGAPFVNVNGEKLARTPLDSTELTIFRNQLKFLFNAPGAVYDVVIASRADEILGAVEAIKYFLTNPRFTGINAQGSELGWSRIRPGNVATAGTTPSVNWFVPAMTSATWKDIISGTNAGSSITLANTHGLIITHVDTPQTGTAAQVTELQFIIGTSTMPPYDVRFMQDGDNLNRVSIAPLPLMVVMPGGTLNVQGVVDSTVATATTGILRLGGLCVGRGSYLNQQKPSAL